MSQQGVPGFPQGNSLYPNSSQGKTPGLPVGDMGLGKTVTSNTDASGNDIYQISGKYGYISKKVYDRRQNRISSYRSSPKNVAPIWTTATAVVVGQTFRLSNGQHITYTTAGNTGAAEPTGYYLGRSINDGTAVAYASEWIKSASDTDAPTVTYAANWAATGLSQQKTLFQAANQQVPTNVISEDGLPFNINSGGGCSNFAGAIGPTPNSITTLVSGSAGSPSFLSGILTEGLAASAFEYDTYICDNKFSLAVGGNTFNLVILIDGVVTQGDTFKNVFGSDNNIVFDFKGVTKWRRVQLYQGFGGAYLKYIGLSQQGRCVTPTPVGDVALLIADSYGDTFSPNANNMFTGLGMALKRRLGLSGLITLASGGCGYVNNNGGAGYTGLQILNSPVNQALFANSTAHKNIKNVIFHMGGNDKNNDRVAAADAALLTWKRARAIWPTAKITAVDSFSAATGPDANNLDWSAKLQAKALEFNDPNFRLVKIVGTDATTAIIYGTGRDGVALGAGTGNASFCISTDNTHPSPNGVNVTSDFISNDIQSQYAQEY